MVQYPVQIIMKKYSLSHLVLMYPQMKSKVLPNLKNEDNISVVYEEYMGKRYSAIY